MAALAFRGRRAFLKRIGGGPRGIVPSILEESLGYTYSIMSDYSRLGAQTFSIIPVSPQSYDTRLPYHQCGWGDNVHWARRHEENRRGIGVVI